LLQGKSPGTIAAQSTVVNRSRCPLWPPARRRRVSRGHPDRQPPVSTCLGRARGIRTDESRDGPPIFRPIDPRTDAHPLPAQPYRLRPGRKPAQPAFPGQSSV